MENWAFGTDDSQSANHAPRPIRCFPTPSPKTTTMREVISIHLGQCGVQCGNACWELYCLVRARAFEPIARDPRASPRWPAPPARATPPLPGPLREAPDRPARVHRVIPSRSPSKPPYPSRPSQRASAPRPPLSLPFTAPSLSRLVALCSFPFAGARHPARRPDALGQDHWRRR